MGSILSKEQGAGDGKNDFLTQDDEIRRTSTTSEKAVLSIPKIYTALSDIFHHVFHLQRGSPFCELNIRIKRSLEECLVSLNYWVKEEYAEVLTESELKTLKSHLSCAQRLNKDAMICAGELVTCLSQVLNLVQKLLVNTTFHGVRSKEDSDAPGVSGTSNIFTRKQPIAPLSNVSDDRNITYQLQHSNSVDTEPDQVLDTLDEILARYDEGTDTVIETNQISHSKQDSGATLVCHQKQDSDCTIINELVQHQEMEFFVDSNDFRVISPEPQITESGIEELHKTPEKMTFKGLFTSFGNKKKQETEKNKSTPIPHIETKTPSVVPEDNDDDDVFKEAQTHTDTTLSDDDEEQSDIIDKKDQGTSESEMIDDKDILSNLVTFLRTSSMRFKRSIGRENSDVKGSMKTKENIDGDDNIEVRGNLSKNVMHDIDLSKSFDSCTSDIDEESIQRSTSSHVFEGDNEKSSVGSAEMCKPVYGYLQRSESGPITLHSTPDSRIDKVHAKPRHNTVPLYRSKLCFDHEDSGFESSFSASFTMPRRNRKKCIAPLSIKAQVARQSQFSDRLQYEEFKFRERNSPNALLETEGLLPALTDVSDDGDDERAEIFFGKFPGKPKVPLKTERDIYHATCRTMQFSDSDDEEITRSKKYITPTERLIDKAGSTRTIDSDASMEIFRPDSIELSYEQEKDVDIIISPLPGDKENLIELFSENYEAIEMICESNLIDRKILTGRLVLWTPDFKQKIQKVYISRQKSGTDIPENSIKLCKDDLERWTLCHTKDNRLCSGSTNILLTVETDTERSESVSTTATSPLYDTDQNNDNMNTDEELYYNIREEMRNLDMSDISSTPNNDELPVSVIDYMNRNFGP